MAQQEAELSSLALPSARIRLVFHAGSGEERPEDVNPKGPFCIFPTQCCVL